jgi:hypothetical protein
VQVLSVRAGTNNTCQMTDWYVPFVLQATVRGWSSSGGAAEDQPLSGGAHSAFRVTLVTLLGLRDPEDEGAATLQTSATCVFTQTKDI